MYDLIYKVNTFLPNFLVILGMYRATSKLKNQWNTCFSFRQLDNLNHQCSFLEDFRYIIIGIWGFFGQFCNFEIPKMRDLETYR